MNQPCFPFVVGCGRSGTTLLRAMLDSHPALVVPFESRFIPALLERDHAFRVDGVLDPDRLVDALRDDEHFRAWDLSEADVRNRLRDVRPADVAGAVRTMFELCATRACKPRYGDKSPPYVMRLPLLAGAFPEGRFIHLVRDGRDVALAFMDADFGPESAARLALHWRLRVERGRQAGTELGPERYLEVHYEDLVAHPEPALRTICAFIDLDYDDAMLGYQQRVEQIVQHDPEPWNHDNLAKPPTVGLRDWRTQMSKRDLARFELLAGSTLERFSYELSGTTATARDRYDAAAAMTTWQAHRVRKRVETKVAPRRIAAAGRKRTERFTRMATAELRALPDFVIIGAQKAGTTSLFRYLVEHPEVIGPAEKEVHFFDGRYERGMRWYRSRFPLRAALERRARDGRRKLTFEASPYYLAHPFVAARMHEHLPDVKLVVLLRDPVERAWSHYRDNVSRGTESEPFLEALRAEAERLAPGLANIARGIDPGPEYRNYGYVERGKYADQLEGWFAVYPREQFLIVESGDLFEDSAATYTRVLRFVGLDLPSRMPAFDVFNATPDAGLDDDARELLEAAFARPNRALASLVGIDFSRRGDGAPA
jgi:hypothetical protein